MIMPFCSKQTTRKVADLYSELARKLPGNRRGSRRWVNRLWFKDCPSSECLFIVPHNNCCSSRRRMKTNSRRWANPPWCGCDWAETKHVLWGWTGTAVGGRSKTKQTGGTKLMEMCLRLMRIPLHMRHFPLLMLMMLLGMINWSGEKVDFWIKRVWSMPWFGI